MPEVLNVSAQIEYTRGDLPRAGVHAEQALELAVDVDRPLEAGRAHARDGTRCVCVYEAPDAEAVRRTNRATGVAFENVWTANPLHRKDGVSHH